MPVRVLTIARNALVECLRQPILFIVVALVGFVEVLAVFATNFAMSIGDSGEIKGDNKLLFDVGLASIFVGGMLIAAFLATAVLSREIENKTVLTVVSKPVSRHVVILGKFLGVSGAIALATCTMLLFLLLALRHGVMTTVGDELDGPVIVFSLLAALTALGLAAWTNFYYGWSFPQVASVLLLPCFLAAYVGVLFLGKGWKVQEPTHDFLPQVTLACVSMGMAVQVLTAAAIAASTRLSQVMTIVVCAAVFLASLLSNFFLGTRAFAGVPLARIEIAEPADPTKRTFRNAGETFHVKLKQQFGRSFKPGDSFYYSRSPNGFPSEVPVFPPFAGSLERSEDLIGPSAPPGVIVTQIQGDHLAVRHIGGTSLRLRRAPEPDDYVFDAPPRIRPVMMAAWSVLPNLQLFWLLDAVTQNQVIPVEHVGLVLAYGLAQIAALLALAVILFQRRDVG